MNYQIYLIIGPTGKKYVGYTSKGCRNRWNCHNNSHRKSPLYSALKKYGRSSFKLKLLKKVYSLKESYFWECFYIKKLNTLYPKGYNLTKGGEGLKATEEVKARIRKKAQIRCKNKKIREEYSRRLKLKWSLPEYREKMIKKIKNSWLDPIKRHNRLEGIRKAVHKNPWLDPEKRKRITEGRWNKNAKLL